MLCDVLLYCAAVLCYTVSCSATLCRMAFHLLSCALLLILMHYYCSALYHIVWYRGISGFIITYVILYYSVLIHIKSYIYRILHNFTYRKLS